MEIMSLKKNNTKNLWKKTHNTNLILRENGLSSGVGLPNYLGKSTSNLYHLSDYQKSALIGIMLGDAHMRIQKSKRSINAHLYYKQSINHYYYLWDVYHIFSPFCKIIPKKKYTKLNSKTFISLEFWTRALPAFTNIYNLFYINNKKVIPNDLYHYFNEISLAYWICDDGTYYAKGGLELCTDSFTLDEVIFLSHILNYFFNLRCTLHTKRKNGYRIYIEKSSMSHLRNLVKPYLPKSMYYKVHL